MISKFNGINRRQFLYGSGIATTALLQACSSTANKEPIAINSKEQENLLKQNDYSKVKDPSNNMIRFFASSGTVADPSKIDLAMSRLNMAGFRINNQEAAYREYLRFAGTDEQRAADFQDIATGKVTTPKILLGVRGGYGAVRIVPKIDWERLSGAMQDHGTILMGFSDVTAIQLALLAKSNVPSFAGPMVYSEFGNPDVSLYTMQSFINGITNPKLTINVSTFVQKEINIEGVFWGGNLSVLTSLVGSEYFPDIKGGILFIEDVSEQPYRIERMLQTLHLAGVLKNQRAILLGDFKMDDVRDTYNSSYDFYAVVATIRRITGLPVLTNFPFGHIRNKATFPLGAQCRLRSGSNGYTVSFSNYPTVDARKLNLISLVAPPSVEENIFPINEKNDESKIIE